MPKKKPSLTPQPVDQEPKSVRIEQAENGFTVSTWGQNGYKQMIAKSEAEAMRHAKTLLSQGKRK